MKQNKSCDISIQTCLEDAGCSEKLVECILDCIENNDEQRKMLLLKKYRCKLLEKIYADQKQIDCLDYLLYQMKQDKK